MSEDSGFIPLGDRLAATYGKALTFLEETPNIVIEPKPAENTKGKYRIRPEYQEMYQTPPTTYELTPATKEKYSKPQPYAGFLARFPRAILAVAAVSVEGAQKHGVSTDDQGFTRIPEAANVLREALCRHLLKETTEGAIDPEWDFLHAAHEAWNAMARLETLLIEKEEADGID